MTIIAQESQMSDELIDESQVENEETEDPNEIAIRLVGNGLLIVFSIIAVLVFCYFLYYYLGPDLLNAIEFRVP